MKNHKFKAIDKVNFRINTSFILTPEVFEALENPNQDKIIQEDQDLIDRNGDKIKDTEWVDIFEKLPNQNYVVMAYGYHKDEYFGDDYDNEENISRICFAYFCSKYGWKNYDNERDMVILEWCYVTYPDGDMFEV